MKRKQKIKKVICLILAVLMILGIAAGAFSVQSMALFLPQLAPTGHKMLTGESGLIVDIVSLSARPDKEYFKSKGNYIFEVVDNILPEGQEASTTTPLLLLKDIGGSIVPAKFSEDLATITFLNIKVTKESAFFNEDKFVIVMEGEDIEYTKDKPALSEQKITRGVSKNSFDIYKYTTEREIDLNTKINKNGLYNVVLKIKDTNINSSAKISDLGAAMVGGSFKTTQYYDMYGENTERGSKVIIQESYDYDSDVMAFDIVFLNLRYNGKGNTLDFRFWYELEDKKRSYDLTATFNEYVFTETKADKEEEDKPLDPIVPHIIVDNYNYGEKTITAGEIVTLNMTIKNTSEEYDLENVVMKITPPEAFSIASSSNTFFIPSLIKNETLEKTIDVQIKSDAKPQSHNVVISFEFQYVANESRKDGKSEENIAIPISQIDRFTINSVDAPATLYMGDEYPMSVSLINKGKSLVYNVTADFLVGKEEPKQTQFIGNVDSGKEATADFFLTGKNPGELKGEIIITYEDSNNNIKTLKQNVDVVVEGEINEPLDPNENIIIDQPTEPIVPVDTKPDETIKTVLMVCGIIICIITTYITIVKIKVQRSDMMDENI